ncbi:Gfo/Idh/MocA family protein [Shimia ponticola]|uniref:Gfo/Idh/MocA family protein n=1 Tax=Shimia ponticola TaxID=2582893 RepID=UPI0011BDF84B|nr:Gfo/Idh/MocA family oxidoreductase [Shimia ponticola]
MNPTFSVACVGAGYFAAFHHEAWQRHPSTKLIGVADRDLDKARATGVPAFDSLETLLDETAPDVPDVIDLVVPPEAHDPLVRIAVAARPKVVICQKPFSTSVAKAKALADLASDAGVALVIHENFRFQPWYRAAHLAMSEGLIGEVHQITFRLRTGDGQGPNAYLDRQPYFQTMPRLLVHETAVHWIDTFRYLLGPVRGVYADTRRMNPVIKGEDAAHILFDFADNKRALFDGNRLLDHAAENCRTTLGEALFEGTEGTMDLRGDGSLWYRKFGDLSAQNLLEARDWPGFAGDCVYALNDHVVRALQGACQLENEAADYLTVRQIEEAVYTSAATQRRVEVS